MKRDGVAEKERFIRLWRAKISGFAASFRVLSNHCYKKDKDF